jgi:hypothetical protein
MPTLPRAIEVIYKLRQSSHLFVLLQLVALATAGLQPGLCINNVHPRKLQAHTTSKMENSKDITALQHGG